jgi:hypothetical protein
MGDYCEGHPTAKGYPTGAEWQERVHDPENVIPPIRRLPAVEQIATTVRGKEPQPADGRHLTLSAADQSTVHSVTESKSLM